MYLLPKWLRYKEFTEWVGGDTQYTGGFTEAGTCGLIRRRSSDAAGQDTHNDTVVQRGENEEGEVCLSSVSAGCGEETDRDAAFWLGT